MGTEYLTKTYEEIRRDLKDALLREMNRYLLPYICDPDESSAIDEDEFRVNWDTYTRPLLFDVLTTPLTTLGLTPVRSAGTEICGAIENENQCRWRANYWDANELGRNGFLRLEMLTIPYSGPYEDLRTYTKNTQDFDTAPWIEDDDVGDWIPPWIGVDGVYHPGHYEGYYDIITSGSGIAANVRNDCDVSSGTGVGAICKPSRIYRTEHAGKWRNLYHEFEYYCDEDYLSGTLDAQPPMLMIYGLGVGVEHGWRIWNYLSNLGLWSVPSTESPGYRLQASRDRYRTTSNLVFGHNREYCEHPDYYSWEDLKDLETKDLKITVERRDDDAVFTIWRRRQYYTGYYGSMGGFVSYPWPLHITSTHQEYDHWPGAGGNDPVIAPDFTPWPESPTGHSSWGFWIPDNERGGETFWYPVDLLHVRLDSADYYDTIYAANYMGRNEYKPHVPSTRYPRSYGYYLRNLDFYEYEISEGMGLFIDGGAYATDSITLHTTSSVPIYPLNTTTTLFTRGATYQEWNQQAPLYVSTNHTFEDVPLYIDSQPFPFTDNESLFTVDLANLEDFTTYTLVDTGSQTTDAWSYTRIDAQGWDNGSDVKWYMDYGTQFFTYTWDINFEFEWGGDGNVDFVPVMVANTVKTDLLPYASCTEEIVAFYYDQTAGTWNLEAFDEGYSATIDSPVAGKHYWCTLGRRGTEAGGYEYYISLWENSARSGTPLSTKTITADLGAYYRYIVVSHIEDVGGSDNISFVLENVWFSNVPSVGGHDLYVYGVHTALNSATLHIEGWAEVLNTYSTMHTFGGTSGWSYMTDSIPLYVSDGGYIGLDGEFSATLYLEQLDTHVDWNASGTLFIEGTYDTLTASIDLTCFGLMTDSEMTLYITTGGDNQNAGYFPDNDQLPLYLNRPDENAVIPLVLYNEWLSFNTYVSLHMNAVLGAPTAEMDLALPDVIWGVPNTYTTLYTIAAIDVNDNITMAMPDTLEALNNNVQLVCYHGGAEPNSYISCHIIGVTGIPTDNITLVIASTYGEQNNDVDMIVKGY